jgi:crotonobetainyl-CoA:carnitine CoA-transferase CaiB-like acyl-CoA transferase
MNYSDGERRTWGDWEVMVTLRGTGVATGVVQHAPDTIEDTQLRSRGSISELVHLVVRKILRLGISFGLSEVPTLQSTPAPSLGPAHRCDPPRTEQDISELD